MKKYIIETVKQMIADGQVAQDVAEKYFPELKESEDEKWIPKEIAKYLKEKGGFRSCWIAWLEKQKANTTHTDWNDYKDKPVEVWNAYVRGLNIGMERGKKAVIKSPKDYGLEKQGEQKPQGKSALEAIKEEKVDNANKVEPKFKVGDWIIYKGTIAKILDLHIHYYVGENVNGDDFAVAYSNAHLMRKWTIQDAKDGDVLADGNLPFIFKKIDRQQRSYAYCGINIDYGFQIESQGELGEWTWMLDIKPATKEQRETLFKAMHEAGYEWDADKKELKKIEQKSAEWSEEDEREYKFALSFSKNAYESCHNQKEYDEGKRVYNWLKSLRPQKQNPWTEQDQKKVERLTTILYDLEMESNQMGKYAKFTVWLNGLCDKYGFVPQKQWKPSDKQIEALDFAADCIVPAEFNFKRKELKGLLEQLKKL